MDRLRVFCGGQIQTAAAAAPAPVQPQGSLADPAAPYCLGNARPQRLGAGGWCHAEQGCRGSPALQMLLQQQGLALLHQQGFKQAIGQL